MIDVIDVNSLVDEPGSRRPRWRWVPRRSHEDPSPVRRAEEARTSRLQTPRELPPPRLASCVPASSMPRGPPPFSAPLTFPRPATSYVVYVVRRQPSIRRSRQPRRSHVNDVNPQQPRHVHKPPAHKSPTRSSAPCCPRPLPWRGRRRASVATDCCSTPLAATNVAPLLFDHRGYLRKSGSPRSRSVRCSPGCGGGRPLRGSGADHGPRVQPDGVVTPDQPARDEGHGARPELDRYPLSIKPALCLARERVQIVPTGRPSALRANYRFDPLASRKAARRRTAYVDPDLSKPAV